MSRLEAALGAVRLEHANEQLQVCHEAVGHLLRLEPHPAPKAGRRPHCRNLEYFCRHRGKTLDRGASSGGDNKITIDRPRPQSEQPWVPLALASVKLAMTGFLPSVPQLELCVQHLGAFCT